MANVTTNLAAAKFGYVRSTAASTHYSVSSGSWYQLKADDNWYMYIGFNNIASNLRHKKLKSVSLVLQAKTGNASLSTRDYNVIRVADAKDFNANTITYNTRPSSGGQLSKVSSNIAGGTGGTDYTIELAGEADYWLPYIFSNFERTLLIEPSMADTYAPLYVNTLLTNASTKPQLRVVYDNAVNITSKISNFTIPGSNVDANNNLTFSWDLVKGVSGYCADQTWIQASAVFYWKPSGASSYSSVQISGAETSVTIPKNTFPTGSTIQCYVSATDTDGTTTQCDVRSFNTYATQITPAAYPTGTAVDNRIALKFTWDFVSSSGGTGYTQGSAKLYWRVSGASSWNQISASGTTKSINAAAYTFPPDSTIEWYLTGTDYSGASSTSSTLTFKTLQTTMAITSAPSGSNIDTRSAITFSWSLTNSAGAVTQASARLFWRVSGSGSYTQISYTGTTKSISAPANTFPTGKTIQWYVSVTDKSGATYTTSATTFNTVTTKVTLDTYPSGSDVYTAAGIKWTWHLASNVGNYTQASAKFYWRISTQQAYTSINISGNTQSLTVAANTFPTNSTIQWYLEATDVGGLTSSTSVMSFKTVSTQITPQNSPTSGYADPRNAITFQWYFASTGGAVPQASATFYWRISGASAWTSVAASGSTASVTIPGNTFPVASTIEWYISGTDIGGTSSTSQEYSFSTAAETAYAYPQAPIGVTVDTGKQVTLRWILANADGTLPSHVELSYKTPNDSSWTVIHEADSAFTAWTTDANYFPVGEIEWRVIATNRDGVEGPAGTAAFISLRAPDAPVGLTATAVPRTTIRWQGGDQEAYEIIIDGETVRQAYGTEVNEWTPDFVLEDGIHVIAVRIQGLYGLWSDPAVTTIDVQNEIPEGWEDLSLSGKLDVDAILTMSGAESPAWSTANWFRDGKRIAVTHGSRTYSDRYVLGEHSWYVELWSADGYYARSNIVTGTLRSCITRIALFEGGDWVDLRLSENSAGLQGFQYGRTASSRHVLGTAYPVLELSEFEDLSGSYDCAFRDVESEAKLEAMRGKVVILKSRGGRVLIGLLSPLETRYTDFYIACSFTVQAVDWEDFRDVL